jgi:hypothetical protein
MMSHSAMLPEILLSVDVQLAGIGGGCGQRQDSVLTVGI